MNIANCVANVTSRDLFSFLQHKTSISLSSLYLRSDGRLNMNRNERRHASKQIFSDSNSWSFFCCCKLWFVRINHKLNAFNLFRWGKKPQGRTQNRVIRMPKVFLFSRLNQNFTLCYVNELFLLVFSWILTETGWCCAINKKKSQKEIV